MVIKTVETQEVRLLNLKFGEPQMNNDIKAQLQDLPVVGMVVSHPEHPQESGGGSGRTRRQFAANGRVDG